MIEGPHSGAGVVATWVDNRWSDAKVVDPYLPTDTHTFINSMSCTSPSFCVAADGNNRTLQWNGAKWTFPHLLNERATNDSFEISCTSSTFCLALGQLSKDDFSWNGHVWKRRSPVPFKNSDNLIFRPGQLYRDDLLCRRRRWGPSLVLEWEAMEPRPDGRSQRLLHRAFMFFGLGL